jgi:hypothetical protein
MDSQIHPGSAGDSVKHTHTHTHTHIHTHTHTHTHTWTAEYLLARPVTQLMPSRETALKVRDEVRKKNSEKNLHIVTLYSNQ